MYNKIAKIIADPEMNVAIIKVPNDVLIFIRRTDDVVMIKRSELDRLNAERGSMYGKSFYTE